MQTTQYAPSPNASRAARYAAQSKLNLCPAPTPEGDRDALIEAHLPLVRYLADRLAARLPRTISCDPVGCVSVISQERFSISTRRLSRLPRNREPIGQHSDTRNSEGIETPRQHSCNGECSKQRADYAVSIGASSRLPVATI